jgi:hypothetical protein
MLIGLAMVFSGLVTLLTLGWVTTTHTLAAARWAAIRRMNDACKAANKTLDKPPTARHN